MNSLKLLIIIIQIACSYVLILEVIHNNDTRHIDST